MRIGFFTDSYRPNLNGVVVSIETFAAEIARLGSRVVLFAPRNEITGFLTQRILCSTSTLPPGIEAIYWVPSLPLITERSQGLALPIARRLRQLSEEHRLDVVHTHTPFGLGYAGVQTGRSLGLPLIHTYHTYYAEYGHYLKAGAGLARRITPAYSRWFCNLHDRILAPSNDIREVLIGYGVRRPVEVLMTGVPIPSETAPADRLLARIHLGIAPDSRVLLFVGRLAREKNIDQLLDVLHGLRRQVDHIEFVIAGDGPDRTRLEQMTRERELSGHVRFLGWIPHPDIETCYRAADVFVSASVTETQGLALLEAMAAGCPVVAVRGPGIVDLITDGASGLLVGPDVASFAARVQDVLSDPDLAGRLGAGARERAGGLDAAHQAALLHERYAELRANARGERRGLRGLATRAREEVSAWR